MAKLLLKPPYRAAGLAVLNDVPRQSAHTWLNANMQNGDLLKTVMSSCRATLERSLLVSMPGTNARPNVGGGGYNLDQMNRRRHTRSTNRLLESGSTVLAHKLHHFAMSPVSVAICPRPAF